MTHRQEKAYENILHTVKTDTYVNDANSTLFLSIMSTADPHSGMKAWENPLILTDEQAKTISASMQAHSRPASVGVVRTRSAPQCCAAYADLAAPGAQRRLVEAQASH